MILTTVANEAKFSEKENFVIFDTEEVGDIEVTYQQILCNDHATSYICDDSIVLHFDDEGFADQYVNSIKSLKYPGGGSKSLEQYMPHIKDIYKDTDGGKVIFITKSPNEQPLSNCIFMKDRHVAWVISRLENIACLLEYNKLGVSDLSIKDFFVDAENHQICLFGGFWRAKKNSPRDIGFIRDIAKELMGYHEGKNFEDEEIPEAFAEFLDEAPLKDAYDDFKEWDTSLILSYGPRKFVQYED